MKRFISIILIIALMVSVALPSSLAEELAEEAQQSATSGEEAVEIITEDPIEAPTEVPTEAPMEVPTDAPAETPTDAPIEAPTETPTDAPTEVPTETQTEVPAEAPTEVPSEAPTEEPTEAPTGAPEDAATVEPTAEATVAPEETLTPRFFDGYAWIAEGSAVYSESGCQSILGSFEDKSVVYVFDRMETETAEQDVVQIAFSVSSEVVTAYVGVSLITELTPEEVADYIQNSGDAAFEDHALANAAFMPTIETNSADEESTQGDVLSDGKWLYQLNGEYASIVGYDDVSATSISIPFEVNGIAVNAIGSRAFSQNTALTELYVHGNVISIADDAFEGLNAVLSGYNGTKVLEFAADKGIPYINRTSVDMAEGIVDYSYAQDGSYRVPDAQTVVMSAANVAQLSVGSEFYIPNALEGYSDFCKVLAMAVSGGEVVLTVLRLRNDILQDGGWLYVIENDYAKVMGYLDYTVTSLDIPDKLGGYYVNAIGDRAFAPNTSLEKAYVHGNVISIADNAFEGLNVTISGYNGTIALDYAERMGLSANNKTDMSVFEFTEWVVDYSYANKGRYEFQSNSSILFQKAEAAQLAVGSIFYVPVKLDDLLGAYEVVSMTNQGDKVLVTFVDAKPEEALTRIHVKDDSLVADWSNAVWTDGVELEDEKFSYEIGASQKLSYPESDHDYANNMDKTWTYTIPGAEALALRFTSDTLFEQGYDKLYIMDAEGNTVNNGFYTGSDLAGKTVIVEDDTVQIRLRTDVSATRYGFAFEFIKPASLK